MKKSVVPKIKKGKLKYTKDNIIDALNEYVQCVMFLNKLENAGLGWLPDPDNLMDEPMIIHRWVVEAFKTLNPKLSKRSIPTRVNKAILLALQAFRAKGGL